MANPNKKKKTGKRKVNDDASKANRKIYLAILIAIVAAVFAPVIQYEFVNFDDGTLIYENPVVTESSVSYLECFRKNLFNVHYKPLVFLSWKAEYQLFGSDAGHFHFFNWLLHILNSILVFLIGARLFKPLLKQDKEVYLSALGLALLFAINPLRLESVAWASERKDVLFAFFFLASWLSYLRYLKSKSYLFILVGALLYLCSGLSKSMGLPLVAILFLTDYFFNRKWEFKLLMEKLPYLIVFVLLLFLYGILGNFGGSLSSSTFATDIPIQPDSMGYLDQFPTFLQWPISAASRFYLWILHVFVPIKLSVAYPAEGIFKFFGKFLYAFPLLFAVLFIWLLAKRQQLRSVFIGMLFFAITISPALALDSIGYGIFLSDRYTYIPSIGLFFILILLLRKLKPNLRNILFLLIAGFYLISTLINLKHWKNSESLFKQVVNVDPSAPIGHLNLGNYYLDNQNYNKAISTYNEGIKHNPNYASLYSNRARVHLDQNNQGLALRDLNKSLALWPEFPNALTNRGTMFGVQGEFDKALNDLNRAIELQPNSRTAYLNRGIVYFNLKDYPRALNDHAKHVSFNPKDYDSINTIAICLNALGRFDEAIEQFNVIIEKRPSNGTFYFNRSMAYHNKGNRKLALDDAKMANQLGYPVNPAYLEPLKPTSGKNMKVN